MKITVLAYQEAGDDQPDIAVQQVAAALERTGHKATIVTIHDDVAGLAESVTKSKPDLVFNLVESFGADIIGGVMGVAGVLDLLQLPYTGGGPGELFLQEDKALSKKLLAYEQVLYPDFATFAPNAEFETGGRLRMPLFVKPLRMDASLGIDAKSLVRNTQELMERVLMINKKFGDAALAEEFIEGREFYVGVLGNQELIAFPPIEMDFSKMPEGAPHILDSAAKWDEKSAEYKGSEAILPDLAPELRAKLQKVALDAYRALRVRDYGRIDMRLTESGEIYVIEVNASCYLEQNSEFATAAKAHGIEYDELVERIATLAVERLKHRIPVKKSRKRSSKKQSAPATA